MTAYRPLSAGLYEIPFGEVLYRPVGYAGGFRTFGDVDMFTLEITPTRKQRYAKNGSVSTLAIEATTRIDSMVSFKAMQKTDFVRAASLLGTPYAVVQAAGNIDAPIKDLNIGELYSVGAYDISAPSLKCQGANGMIAVPANMLKLVDPALGMVELLGLPDGATADANGNIAGTLSATKAAITADMARTRVDIGTVPQVELELIVRNLSDVGTHSALWLFQANLAPDGAQGFITANEDFEGQGVKGRAARVSNPYGDPGVGFYQALKKAA